jgi:hypothetical protein
VTAENTTPLNLTHVLNKSLGKRRAAAVTLLSRIVYWCTRKKGGVMHEGRLWSYRSQQEWIDQEVGLAERTGKRAWAYLVADDYIMTDMRLGGPKGNRKMMMHVALSDKTYALLEGAGIPHLELPILTAEAAKKTHEKDKSKKKTAADWDAMKAADPEFLDDLSKILG